MHTNSIWRVCVLLLIGIVPMQAQQVNLHLSNVSLQSVFASIQKQTGFEFMYSRPPVNSDSIVSITAVNEDLSLVLDKLFKGTGLTYQIEDQQVIVSRPQSPAKSLVKVTGTVVDGKEPIIGASVMVKGTTLGTITDLDGMFYLDQVPAGSSIEISYMGYVTQYIKAVSTHYQISLIPDVQKLDEVIVVGYGSSKIKDLTSPIVTVKGDELVEVPVVSAMSALQGKVAGVQVNNSGTPGAAPSVRIRGLGSFSNSSPLYVVDGMFYDNINFLNSSDIEDISIMKDASASAIYGVRAANGVVIVTTKKGKANQPPRVTYDGYVGVQTVANRLQMCSSNQYAQMLMEANPDAYFDILDASLQSYGGTYDEQNGFNLNCNTDWYNQLIKPAVITSHSINVGGGSDKATYAISASYLYQDGVLDSENDYSRFNFRGNIEYSPWKWFTVGFNSVFANTQQRLPNNAAWQQAYNVPGIFPVYDSSTADIYTDGFASPNTVGLTNNFYNPVATAKLYDSRNDGNQLLAGLFAQFNIIPNKLNIRTSYNYDYTGLRATVYNQPYFLGTESHLNRTISNLTKSTTTFNNWIWDNTITYTDQWGKHNFKAMLGLSLREEKYYYLGATAQDVPQGKDSYMYISLGSTENRTTGDDGYRYRAFSYFARINYGYDDRYLASFTIRRDGSSKYNEKWGTFPSVGLAWVLSNENWLKDVDGVDYLKLRASWGLLGNDKIGASYGTTSSIVERAVYGTNNALSGYINSSNFSWLSWEKVNETDIGTDFAFLGNRLSGEIDWYYRLTQNAVIEPTLPMQNATVAGNWAEILNMGIDANLQWNHQVNKDWSYTIGANFGWLKNRVQSLRDNLQMVKGSKTVQMVGEKMNSYYGYKVVGIYQTEEECLNDPIAVENGLQPGDFKYEDVNGDQVINEQDKQILGSYVPDFTYGINLGFKWRGLDFEVVFSGQAGAELWNRKRALRYACPSYNFDLAQYSNRWTGANSTNTNPSAAALMRSWNVGDSQNASYFVESADYFRIQNATLGYTFTQVGVGAYKMPSIRISLSADKPYTCFKANSMTPELSDSQGWDTEVYPLTGTYSFAVQLNF